MAPSRNRNYDNESGMNRTRPQTRSRKPKRQPDPAPPSDDSEEYISSDSELENDLNMPKKDDTRRPPPKRPNQARKGQTDGQSRDFPGAEERIEDTIVVREKVEHKVPAHIAILQASVYHVGISTVSRPASSSYIPTAMNLFAMISAIVDSLVENSRLHEFCPEFFSPCIYLYYGHVVYFHILRARLAAGSDILTRTEKRILTAYERIGPAESWPIAAPLVGFIQALGSHKSADSYYSWIVPKFPDFSQLETGNGLSRLEHVAGLTRLPIVPALQKVVYNFASGTAIFAHGQLQPIQSPLSATQQFIGIASSAENSSSFNSLAFNSCWNLPAESGQDYHNIKQQVKRRRLSRWSIPDVPNVATLNTAENFLGFDTNSSFDWMKHLLNHSAAMNRFFPGSTNLASIPPITTLGSLTHIEYSRKELPLVVKDRWYYDRGDITFGFRGFSNTEDGMADTRLGLATATNSEFSTFFPTIVGSSDPARTGPFFVDHANANINRERNHSFLSEGTDEQDPARRYYELVPQYIDIDPTSH